MERYRGIEDVPSTRARRMHQYWLDKKGERAMPARSNIDHHSGTPAISGCSHSTMAT